jgi:hypothetical protein
MNRRYFGTAVGCTAATLMITALAATSANAVGTTVSLGGTVRASEFFNPSYTASGEQIRVDDTSSDGYGARAVYGWNSTVHHYDVNTGGGTRDFFYPIINEGTQVIHQICYKQGSVVQNCSGVANENA